MLNAAPLGGKTSGSVWKRESARRQRYDARSRYPVRMTRSEECWNCAKLPEWIRTREGR